jgi:prepilin-type N-terminal cleavage/methylation domain-containing protein
MRKGFSLIELLVVIGIIGLLATIVAVSLFSARKYASDTVRKAELNQMGRFLLSSACYVPDGGAGDYDLKVLYDQAVAANPQVKQFMASVPRDPKTGNADQSGFRYLYTESGHCALYANLENPATAIDLPALTEPTAGGGTGVLKASAPGPNGTDRYYQIGL